MRPASQTRVCRRRLAKHKPGASTRPRARTMVLSARTSFKKLPGLLEINASHIVWTQDGKNAPSINVPKANTACMLPVLFRAPPLTLTETIALFSSKAGA